MLRKWIIAVGSVVLIAAVGFFGYWKALEHDLIRYNEYDIRTEGSLQVGDLAPDLELQSVDGSGTRHLSDFWRDKPLVLVFGSYT